MKLKIKYLIACILAFIFCMSQMTQGWCVSDVHSLQCNTIATHVDGQKVTEAFRPGKAYLPFIKNKIKDNLIVPTKKTTLATAKKIHSKMKIFFAYLLECISMCKYYRGRLLSKRQSLSGFRKLILEASIIVFIMKPILIFITMAFLKGSANAPIYSLDPSSVTINPLHNETNQQDGTQYLTTSPSNFMFDDPFDVPDYMSIPDSLRAHFWNYAIGKETVKFVVDPDTLFLPSQIVVTNGYDYHILDSIACGKIPTNNYWRNIAQHSIRQLERNGGWQTLERKIIDKQLLLMPRTKINYKIKTGKKSYWRTYFKPVMQYLKELAKKMPPLPNIVVPILPEAVTVNKIQKIIENAVENNLPINEKDLTAPMTHYMARYLMQAAPDLEVFILPPEYLTGMYAEPHPDFFTIEWLNAQRHPRVDSTTALIEIHLEADVLGFGNYAYPKLLPKMISRNGNGMARYSHFLEYPNAELLETIPLGDLVASSPKLFKVYIARKVDEIITDLRKSQPHIKKIALIYGHANGTYQSPKTKKPSKGWSATYDPKDVTFHRKDSIVTWENKIERNNAKGYNYGYNKIKRTWLLRKSKKTGAIYGINSKEISRLRELGVLTWTKDSSPYVHFTDMILRNGGKYILRDKMREMGWQENGNKWTRLMIALRKHGDYSITLDQIMRYDLYEAVERTGWPVANLDASVQNDLYKLFNRAGWSIKTRDQQTTTDIERVYTDA